MILFYFLISAMPLSVYPVLGKIVAADTATKYVGVLCLLYALVYAPTRRSPPLLFATWQARWFAALMALGMVSFLMKGDTAYWQLSPMVSYVSFFLLFLITLLVVDSQARLRMVVLTAIGSIAVGSIYVLKEWYQYHNTYQAFRPGWAVGDANYFSISALTCLPAGYCLLRANRPGKERWFLLGCLVLALLAITAAASRGGFLGLSVASLWIVWRSPKRVRSFTVVAVTLVALNLSTPMSPLRRLLQPNFSDDEARDARTTVWKAGKRMIVENPLTGVGLGNYKRMVTEYAGRGEEVVTVAHNAYIEFAAEMGIPGLLIFVAMMYSAIRSLERVQKQALRLNLEFIHKTALGLQAGLLGLVLALNFVSGQYQKLLWLMLFVSMCLPHFTAAAAVAKRKKAAEQSSLKALPNEVWEATGGVH